MSAVGGPGRQLRVGLTGASGFLGWHLRCHLDLAGHQLVVADRETFANEAALDNFVASSDIIIHAAGINRNSEVGDVSANTDLAGRLVAAMTRTGHVPATIYTNSTQAEAAPATGNNPYGTAKMEAAEILESHLSDCGVRFVNLIIPHLFGEFGRPFYNSAVTTFAHQLVVGEEPTINGDGQLELLHTQDVANRILGLLADQTNGRERMDGQQISVADSWSLLSRLYVRYVNEATIPFTTNLFELRMFNLLRSQLYLNGFYPRAITLHDDSRGSFAELCRADGLGQTSISTTVPGVTRGDHFHLDKVERFVVVSGEATIRLRRLHSTTVDVFRVSGDAPVVIDMPPLTTHNITNTGDDILTTVFWAGDHFDPTHPDTFIKDVDPGNTLTEDAS